MSWWQGRGSGKEWSEVVEWLGSKWGRHASRFREFQFISICQNVRTKVRNEAGEMGKALESCMSSNKIENENARPSHILFLPKRTFGLVRNIVQWKQNPRRFKACCYHLFPIPPSPCVPSQDVEMLIELRAGEQRLMALDSEVIATCK